MSVKQYENPFRPLSEAWAVSAWSLSIAVLLLYRPPFWFLLLVIPVAMLRYRFISMRKLLGFRFMLASNRIRTIALENMLSRSKKMAKERILSTGVGFQWSQRHAERAVQILNMNRDELLKIPSFLVRYAERIEKTPKDKMNILQKFVKSQLLKDTRPVLDTDIGEPWIHGLGVGEEKNIGIPFSAMPGHTLITGTTRAGKTRLYELLTAQIVDIGAALIVIDPKKDVDWVSMLRLMCERKGRKFLYFDPATPAESIRLQPLQNWNNISETATRIGQLVDADGSFAAFAWKTLYRVHRALIAAGERPTIRNTKRYVQLGVEGLAEKILTIFLREKLGPEWDRDLKNMPADQQRGKNAMTRLDWCIAKYEYEKYEDDTIDGIISMVKHSKEHYSKMVQVLEPILEMLGSDEVGDLLSPDPTDLSDEREIWNLRRVLDEKAVLYVGLDSLSNKIIASAIGSILLADLASSLGAIYNFSSPTDAYLFVDEVAEVANDQLIQILNKGGGAGIKCFLAMQAIADLKSRLGSAEKCEQVLANLNNLITLRVRSVETAEYISQMFGSVATRTQEVSYSSGSESSSSFTEFRTQVSRSLKSERSSLVPSELLTRLPPLNYFAFVAGRSIYKGVLEFIEADRSKYM